MAKYSDIISDGGMDPRAELERPYMDEIERLRRVERAARGLIDAYPFNLPAYTPYSTKWAALKAALEEK